MSAYNASTNENVIEGIGFASIEIIEVTVEADFSGAIITGLDFSDISGTIDNSQLPLTITRNVSNTDTTATNLTATTATVLSTLEVTGATILGLEFSDIGGTIDNTQLPVTITRDINNATTDTDNLIVNTSASFPPASISTAALTGTITNDINSANATITTSLNVTGATITGLEFSDIGGIITNLQLPSPITVNINNSTVDTEDLTVTSSLTYTGLASGLSFTANSIASSFVEDPFTNSIDTTNVTVTNIIPKTIAGVNIDDINISGTLITPITGNLELGGAADQVDIVADLSVLQSAGDTVIKHNDAANDLVVSSQNNASQITINNTDIRVTGDVVYPSGSTVTYSAGSDITFNNLSANSIVLTDGDNTITALPGFVADGTFTPSLTNISGLGLGSTTVTYARYTRLGQLVFFFVSWATVNITAVGRVVARFTPPISTSGNADPFGGTIRVLDSANVEITGSVVDFSTATNNQVAIVFQSQNTGVVNAFQVSGQYYIA